MWQEMIEAIVQLSSECWGMLAWGMRSRSGLGMLWLAVGFLVVLAIHTPLAFVWTFAVSGQRSLLLTYASIWQSHLIQIRVSDGLWRAFEMGWLMWWIVGHFPAVVWLGIFFWVTGSFEVR